LWGRVVEHELGWRAQYAYPYALTVHGPPEVARAIRALYAVEVEEAEPIEPTPKEESKEDDKASLASMAKQLAEIRIGRAPVDDEFGEDEQDDTAAESWVPRFEFSRDEALTALFYSLAYVRPDWTAAEGPPWPRIASWCRHGEVSDAADALVRMRSLEEKSGNLRAPLRQHLRDAEGDGLLRSGMWDARASVRWRFTSEGARHLRALGLPETVTVSERGRDPVTLEVSIADGLARIEKPLQVSERFEDEIEAMKPAWEAQRRKARAKGRRAYGAWLRHFRKGADSCRLYYSDEEVEAALRAAVRRKGGEVDFPALMFELAPGKYDRQETARVAQALVRLRRNRKAVQVSEGPPKLWDVA
jgi:hypothetical protein